MEIYNCAHADVQDYVYLTKRYFVASNFPTALEAKRRIQSSLAGKRESNNIGEDISLVATLGITWWPSAN